MRTIIKVAIGILLLIVGIGYISRRKIDTDSDPRFKPYSDLNADDARLLAHLVTGSPPPPDDPLTCLSLASYKRTPDEGSMVITGSVKNACARRYSNVQITFKLFDTSGRVVGTALANQNNLDGGEMRNFKAHGVLAPGLQFDHITAFY
jgi:hypothetical protein